MSSVPLDLKTLEEDFGELSETSHLSEEEERELSKKVASDILAGFDKHYRLFRYYHRLPIERLRLPRHTGG